MHTAVLQYVTMYAYSTYVQALTLTANAIGKKKRKAVLPLIGLDDFIYHFDSKFCENFVIKIRHIISYNPYAI